jgi:hypothetical protein
MSGVDAAGDRALMGACGAAGRPAAPPSRGRFRQRTSRFRMASSSRPEWSLPGLRPDSHRLVLPLICHEVPGVAKHTNLPCKAPDTATRHRDAHHITSAEFYCRSPVGAGTEG